MQRSLTTNNLSSETFYPDLTTIGWSYEERLTGSRKNLYNNTKQYEVSTTT